MTPPPHVWTALKKWVGAMIITGVEGAAEALGLSTRALFACSGPPHFPLAQPTMRSTIAPTIGRSHSCAPIGDVLSIAVLLIAVFLTISGLIDCWRGLRHPNHRGETT
jgi:hypothetical protein